jgi:hypothetical protein
VCFGNSDHLEELGETRSCLSAVACIRDQLESLRPRVGSQPSTHEGDPIGANPDPGRHQAPRAHFDFHFLDPDGEAEDIEAYGTYLRGKSQGVGEQRLDGGP